MSMRSARPGVFEGSAGFLVAFAPRELLVVRRREGRAFTLLELLVVITVIAVLISILAPTLGTARDRARLTVCLANHKAIITGVALYRGRYQNMFPYNYGTYYSDGQRWALDGISEFVNGVGGPEGELHGKSRSEGQFPNAYICPSANLDAVYTTNPSDNYHACYWTNVAVRLNRGFGPLFYDYSRSGHQPGWDVDSGGIARITGACPRCRNWRSVYHPTLDSIRCPDGVVFSGDSTNQRTHYVRTGASNTSADAGNFRTTPGTYPTFGVFMGFDRHGGDKLPLSYVDGSVRTMPWSQVLDYSGWGSASGVTWTSWGPLFVSTGAWLVKYTGMDQCTDDGTGRHHHLPLPVVE